LPQQEPAKIKTSHWLTHSDVDTSIASTNSTETLEHNSYTVTQPTIPAAIRIHPIPPIHNDNYYTRNDLHQWLTTARQSGITNNTSMTTDDIIPAKHKSTKTGHKQPLQPVHQPTFQHYKDNPHWGD